MILFVYSSYKIKTLSAEAMHHVTEGLIFVTKALAECYNRIILISKDF